MRIHYPPRNNQHSRNAGREAFFLIFTLGIFLGVHFFFPTFFPSILSAVGQPLWSWRVTLNNFFTEKFALLASKQYLVKENQHLNDRIKELSDELVISRGVRGEEDGGAISRSSFRARAVRAVILVRPPQTIYDTFILDAGSVQNVSKGDLVFAAEGILIGEITRVSETTSLAELFSSPYRETIMRLSGTIDTLAHGRGGGVYELKVPRELPIVLGDVALKPGRERVIYGTLSHIEFSETDSFKYVFLRIPENIFELREVYVLQDLTDEKKLSR